MTESRRPYGATQPEPIDDNEDRMGSMEPLDFDQRRDERKGRIGDQVPADASKGTIESLADNSEEVARFSEGRLIKKIVVVPGRLVNVVV